MLHLSKGKNRICIPSARRSANAYAALAGIVAAGLDGVRRHARLPPPCNVPPEALPDAPALRLVTSPAKAAQLLAADALLRAELGEVFCSTVLVLRTEDERRWAGTTLDEQRAALDLRW